MGGDKSLLFPQVLLQTHIPLRQMRVFTARSLLLHARSTTVRILNGSCISVSCCASHQRGNAVVPPAHHLLCSLGLHRFLCFDLSRGIGAALKRKPAVTRCRSMSVGKIAIGSGRLYVETTGIYEMCTFEEPRAFELFGATSLQRCCNATQDAQQDIDRTVRILA